MIAVRKFDYFIPGATKKQARAGATKIVYWSGSRNIFLEDEATKKFKISIICPGRQPHS